MSLKNKEREHNARTRSIWMKPDLIGLEDILMSTNEVNMFRKDKSLYHQPDNLFFDYNHFVIYNCEYKCSGKQRTKAVKQLRETASYLRTMFRNYDIVNYYIHDDFQKERIS